MKAALGLPLATTEVWLDHLYPTIGGQFSWERIFAVLLWCVP